MKHKKLFFILLLCGICMVTYAAAYRLTCQVSPEHPHTSDYVTISITGEWGDSCIPNQKIKTRNGNDFYISITSSYPPGIACLTVITPFTFNESLGYLEEGQYTVYISIDGTYSTSCIFTVNDNQFIMDTSSIEVPEGKSSEVNIALFKPPPGDVRVDVTPISGDEDIIVSSGSVLYFDPGNYSIPQTISIMALDDSDYYSNETKIRVYADGYNTSIIDAREIDDDVPQIVYVDSDANGNDNGLSWADAFSSFESALDVVKQVPGIQEIKVAGGTYKTNESMKNFVIVSGCSYSGSYAGVKCKTPDVRSIFSFPTIFSSDVNGDDGPGFLNRSDNNAGVVLMENCSPDTILDGFVISGGEEAWGGGGVFVKGGGPVIKNCVITDNRAHYGAGIHIQGSRATINNCLIVSNSANISTIADGGGVYMNGLESKNGAIIQNCTIALNSAGESGGGIVALWGTLHIKDSIVWGNSVYYGNSSSNQLYRNEEYDGEFDISFSCIQDADYVDGIDGNITADPEFTFNHLGSYFLSNLNSQGINSPCIDAGSDDTVILDMNDKTTDTRLKSDMNIVDIGFHYPYYLHSIRPGDVDLTNDVTIIDALLVAQVYVGIQPDIFIFEAANVNSDEQINILDALLIAQFYVGIISEFPGEWGIPLY